MEEPQLTDFVAGILEDYEELLLEKRIDVIMEADGSDSSVIWVDKRLFAKVISNACHYFPAGEEIRIQITKVNGVFFQYRCTLLVI